MVVILLFHFTGQKTGYMWTYAGLPVRIPAYSLVLGLLIVLGSGFAIYRLVGKPRAWWVMPAVAAVIAVLTESPLMGFLQDIFSFGASGRGGFVQSFI